MQHLNDSRGADSAHAAPDAFGSFEEVRKVFACRIGGDVVAIEDISFELQGG